MQNKNIFNYLVTSTNIGQYATIRKTTTQPPRPTHWARLF